MPQNTANRKGYMSGSITISTTLARFIDLVKTQLGIDLSLSGSWREVQFQVDPETSAGLSVRIGDGSTGTTVGGIVQKGATLVGASAADTYRGSGANAIYALMMNMQAVSGSPIINYQLLEE